MLLLLFLLNSPQNFFYRTHSEQLSESSRDGLFRMEGIERKVTEIGLQVQVTEKSNQQFQGSFLLILKRINQNRGRGERGLETMKTLHKMNEIKTKN